MFLLDDFKLEDYENYYCATTILNTTNKKISYPYHGIFYIDSSNSEIKSNKKNLLKDMWQLPSSDWINQDNNNKLLSQAPFKAKWSEHGGKINYKFSITNSIRVCKR